MKKIFKKIKTKADKSLKLQLILSAVIALIISMALGIFINELTFQKDVEINNQNINNLDNELREVTTQLRDIMRTNDNDLWTEKFKKAIDKESMELNINLYVVDNDGNLLCYSEVKKDLSYNKTQLCSMALSSELPDGNVGKIQRNYYMYNEGICIEKISAYTQSKSDIINKSYYVIIRDISKSAVDSADGVERNDSAFYFITFLSFIVIFSALIRRRVSEFEDLNFGILEIAKGNLNYTLNVKSDDEIGTVAQNINKLTDNLKLNIENEKQNEKIKNDLITNMSHDLKTPLTSVIGYLNMLKDKKYKDEQEMDEFVSVANNKAETLKVLIEDLFYYSKLNNGEEALYKAEINLAKLLNQLLEELVPLFEKKNITLIKVFQPIQSTVYIDGEKMVRAFENILGNAIKYTPESENIKVILRSVIDTTDEIEVVVENYAPNLKEAEIPYIFDRLFRAENSRSSNLQGSGLGLAIAKSIVTLHGGSIGAKYKDNIISIYIRLKIMN